MVKLDENNEAANIKMPKTNFRTNEIFKKIKIHALYLGEGFTFQPFYYTYLNTTIL